jgi:hypothetical protein
MSAICDDSVAHVQTANMTFLLHTVEGLSWHCYRLRFNLCTHTAEEFYFILNDLFHLDKQYHQQSGAA